MSSTRHAPAGAPFRQERFASDDAFNIGLNGLLVAKRCEVTNPAQADLIWFLQNRSHPARDGVGGRIGGIDRIAAELLPWIPTAPQAPTGGWVEDFSSSGGTPARELDAAEMEEARSRESTRAVACLAQELTEWALDPRFDDRETAPKASWKRALAEYRQHCCDQAKTKLAATSISAVVWDALEFTRGTAEASLIIGEPRIGKSETAKVFCESQGGLARYVEVPATNDERSMYKAVAESLGVACGLGFKAVEIRERVIEVLRRSKIMLVFDEAQNLWTRNMRPRSSPDRVLWINSLINMGVPVALIALPEFTTWMRICAEKTGWSPRQVEQRITIHRRLPDSLTMDDFQTLARHLAPLLPPPAVTFLVGCALEQDGAAFVKKVLSAASYRATKAGRPEPSFDDIQAAVRDDIMPSVNSLRDALAPRLAQRGRTATAPAAAPAAAPVVHRPTASVTSAAPLHRARNAAAVPVHGTA